VCVKLIKQFFFLHFKSKLNSTAFIIISFRKLKWYEQFRPIKDRFKMKIENFKKTIFSNRFAYLLGYFAADGSFYKDGRNTRFEFSDGTSVASEL
jgi:hypothetical protein